MPHLPDHQTSHDPLLIAAFAAGDAEGADLERARDLVATCDDCAALHHDLRAISASMPALPARTRPRDFRLTPEQAASLRPAGWRRLLAPLAGPRFAFAAPLGGSLAALGIAGILVAGLASAPIAGVGSGTGTGANPTTERQAVSASAAPGDAALSGPASNAPSAASDDHYAAAAASQLPAAAAPGEALTGPAATDSGNAAGGTTESAKDPDASPAGRLDTTVAAPAPAPVPDTIPTVAATPPPLLAIASVALLGFGVLLLALRVAGRRSQSPG